MEGTMSPNDRVYCANTDCAKFKSPQNFQNQAVRCDCGCTTCSSCKTELHADHVCSTPHRIDLPAYRSNPRVKECPKCEQGIELAGACNHMRCAVCRHHFCFTCLLPRRGQHADCPRYGDYERSYDKQGYERCGRHLHVQTGIDRNGYNRFGGHLTDPNRDHTWAGDLEPVPEQAQEAVGMMISEFSRWAGAMKVACSENYPRSFKQAIDHVAKHLYIVVQAQLNLKHESNLLNIVFCRLPKRPTIKLCSSRLFLLLVNIIRKHEHDCSQTLNATTYSFGYVADSQLLSKA